MAVPKKIRALNKLEELCIESARIERFREARTTGELTKLVLSDVHLGLFPESILELRSFNICVCLR